MLLNIFEEEAIESELSEWSTLPTQHIASADLYPAPADRVTEATVQNQSFWRNSNFKAQGND